MADVRAESTSGVDQEPLASTLANQQQEPEPTPSGWECFYGLAWYGTDGRPRLTSWRGDRPIVAMLSLDCAEWRIPLWDAEVPRGAKLVPMPDTREEFEEAERMRGGRKVIGWRMEQPFARKAWNAGAPVPAVDPSRSSPHAPNAVSAEAL